MAVPKTINSIRKELDEILRAFEEPPPPVSDEARGILDTAQQIVTPSPFYDPTYAPGIEPYEPTLQRPDPLATPPPEVDFSALEKPALGPGVRPAVTPGEPFVLPRPIEPVDWEKKRVERAETRKQFGQFPLGWDTQGRIPPVEIGDIDYTRGPQSFVEKYVKPELAATWAAVMNGIPESQDAILAQNQLPREDAMDLIETGKWDEIREHAENGIFPTADELGMEYLFRKREELLSDPYERRGQAEWNILKWATTEPSSSKVRRGVRRPIHIIPDDWIRKHPYLSIIPVTLTAPFEIPLEIGAHPKEWPGAAAYYVAGKYMIAPATAKGIQWLGKKFPSWSEPLTPELVQRWVNQGGKRVREVFRQPPAGTVGVDVTKENIGNIDEIVADAYKKVTVKETPEGVLKPRKIPTYEKITPEQKNLMQALVEQGKPVKVFIPKEKTFARPGPVPTTELLPKIRNIAAKLDVDVRMSRTSTTSAFTPPIISGRKRPLITLGKDVLIEPITVETIAHEAAHASYRQLPKEAKSAWKSAVNEAAKRVKASKGGVGTERAITREFPSEYAYQPSGTLVSVVGWRRHEEAFAEMFARTIPLEAKKALGLTAPFVKAAAALPKPTRDALIKIQDRLQEQLAILTPSDVSDSFDVLGRDYVDSALSIRATGKTTDEAIVKTLAKAARSKELTRMMEVHGAEPVLDMLGELAQKAKVKPPSAADALFDEEVAEVIEELRSDGQSGAITISKRQMPTEIEDPAVKRALLAEPIEKKELGTTGRAIVAFTNTMHKITDFVTAQDRGQLLRDDPALWEWWRETRGFSGRSIIDAELRMALRMRKLSRKQRIDANRLIDLNSLWQGYKDGIPLPEGLDTRMVTLPTGDRVPAIELELVQFNAKVAPEVREAVEKWRQHFLAVAADQVARGKIFPDDVKEFWAPYRYIEHMRTESSFWSFLPWVNDVKATFPFLPRTLTKEPFRWYTIERRGTSELSLATGEDIKVAADAWIDFHNHIEDFLYKTLDHYDIFPGMKKSYSPDQLDRLFGKKLRPRKGHPGYLINGKMYMPVQPEVGNVVYEAAIADPKNLTRVLKDVKGIGWYPGELDAILKMSPEDAMTTLINKLQNVGPQGGAALRLGRVLGKAHRVYLVPEHVHKMLAHFTDAGMPSAIRPFIQATRAWKPIPLVFNPGYHIRNLMGDIFSLTASAPGAGQPRHLGQAWNYLTTVTSGDMSKLTTAEQLERFKQLKERDVLGAAFFADMEQMKYDPFWKKYMTPKGLYYALQNKAGFREAFLRVAMFDYQMDRIKQGKIPISHIHQDIVDRIYETDPVGAAAFISRTDMIDYSAVPRWFRDLVSGLNFPYATFFVKETANLARWIAKEPGDAMLKMLVPALVGNQWNNTWFADCEAAMDPSARGKLHLWLRKRYKEEDAERPVEGLLFQPDLPHSQIMEYLGFDLIMDKVALIKAGKMTAKQAAAQQIIDTLGYDRRRGGLSNAALALMGPMHQMFWGLSTDVDPRTKKRIIPKEYDNLPAEDKIPQQLTYVVGKLITPFAQYATQADVKDIFNPEFSDAVGPGKALGQFATHLFDIPRALGFRWVNLHQARFSQQMEIVRKAEAHSNKIAYDLKRAWIKWDGTDVQDFLRSDAFKQVHADASVRGVIFPVAKKTLDDGSEFISIPAETMQMLTSASVWRSFYQRKMREAETKEEKRTYMAEYNKALDLILLETMSSTALAARAIFLEDWMEYLKETKPQAKGPSIFRETGQPEPPPAYEPTTEEAKPSVNIDDLIELGREPSDNILDELVAPEPEVPPISLDELIKLGSEKEE